MKLSSREALLLKVTAVIALFALSYYFVISPQLDKLTAAGERLASKTLEVESVKEEIQSIPQLENEIKALKDNIHLSSQGYYPEIQQKQLILLLDEQLRLSNASSDSLGFSQITLIENVPAANAGETPVAGEGAMQPDIQSMSVQSPLLGRYEDIMGLIGSMEGLNRKITIDNLQLTQGTEGLISGSISLNFYSLNKLTADPQDEDYLSWPYPAPLGAANPFPLIPVEEPTTTDEETPEGGETATDDQGDDTTEVDAETSEDDETVG